MHRCVMWTVCDVSAVQPHLCMHRWTVCDVSVVQPHLYFGLFGWGQVRYNDGLLLFIVRYYVGLCTFLCILVVKYFIARLSNLQLCASAPAARDVCLICGYGMLG